MDHENPMGWLYLTAKNKLMKLQSRKKSMYSLDDTKYFHFKAREIKEFKYGEIELAETIRNSVSEKEYEMLRDYYLNGYSSEEVAEKYGVDKGSIRMRMSRLKKRLREELIVGWLIFFVLCFRAVL